MKEGLGGLASLPEKARASAAPIGKACAALPPADSSERLADRERRSELEDETGAVRLAGGWCGVPGALANGAGAGRGMLRCGDACAAGGAPKGAVADPPCQRSLEGFAPPGVPGAPTLLPPLSRMLDFSEAATELEEEPAEAAREWLAPGFLTLSACLSLEDFGKPASPPPARSSEMALLRCTSACGVPAPSGVCAREPSCACMPSVTME